MPPDSAGRYAAAVVRRHPRPAALCASGCTSCPPPSVHADRSRLSIPVPTERAPMCPGRADRPARLHRVRHSMGASTTGAVRRSHGFQKNGIVERLTRCELPQIHPRQMPNTPKPGFSGPPPGEIEQLERPARTGPLSRAPVSDRANVAPEDLSRRLERGSCTPEQRIELRRKGEILTAERAPTRHDDPAHDSSTNDVHQRPPDPRSRATSRPTPRESPGRCTSAPSRSTPASRAPREAQSEPSRTPDPL